jgi:DNA-binding CsgD family transcriptional regulator
LYAAVCHPVGTEYILKLRLPATDGIECGFVFESKDRDFTQRDVAVLQLVYPHLLQLRRNAAVRRREARLRAALERELEAAEECGRLEQLTNREREVLSWVARGKTNVEVADLLGMAPATVRKHLEHIYDKLGVTTRTAAAIRALGV